MSVLLLYSKQFQALRTLLISLDGMDVIVKLATFYDLDGGSNRSQFILV